MLGHRRASSTGIDDITGSSAAVDVIPCADCQCGYSSIVFGLAELAGTDYGIPDFAAETVTIRCAHE